MDTGFDTAKIAYGDRPFIYKPPPLSVRASYWIGVVFVLIAAVNFIVALWAGANFGLTQFSAVFGTAFGLLVIGVLICAFAQACKAQFDNLQINAYRGKNG